MVMLRVSLQLVKQSACKGRSDAGHFSLDILPAAFLVQFHPDAFAILTEEKVLHTFS